MGLLKKSLKCKWNQWSINWGHSDLFPAGDWCISVPSDITVEHIASGKTFSSVASGIGNYCDRTTLNYTNSWITV